MNNQRLLHWILAICGMAASFCCNSNNLLTDTPDGKDGPFTAADRAYVFVSSQTTVGNMTGLTAGGCSGGGVGQADCACTALAKSANLLRRRDSRFVAWLSTQTDWARCRLLGTGGTACGSTGGEPWYGTNGMLVAANLASLLNTGVTPFLNAIAYDETGVFNNSVNTFTGTLENGSLIGANQNCSDWSNPNDANAPRYGNINATATAWTNGSGAGTCNAVLPVYCFALP